MIAARIIHDNPRMPFPKGFFWGAATSSHQVEGDQHNDWSEWEKKNAERLAQIAKNRWGHISGWEEKFGAEASRPENYISGINVDHWNRYEEDFDILKSLNLNAYRFSIEWSRVEPREGQFDEAVIEHYRQMILSLQRRNIEPFVTLWHWSNPLWIRDQGDWSNRRTVQYYLRYVEKMVTALNTVKFWITVNEPNIHTMYAYVLGKQPPGKKSLFLAAKTFFHILNAHREAARVIHSKLPGAQVGMANSVICFEPKNIFILNRWAAKICQYFWNVFSFTFTKESNDFLGINYYSRQLVGFGPKTIDDDYSRNDLGWTIYPQGILPVLREIRKLRLPVYITENGLADAADTQRTDFIRDHLTQIHRAIAEGVDIRGYLHWSLLDNNEFVEIRGYWPRFGLVAVDRTTQKRTVRESAKQYAALVAKYRAEEK